MNRATTRDLDDILRDDERMANLAMNRGQMVRELREALAHERALNERLRRVIADQAALLDGAEPSQPAPLGAIKEDR